MGRKRGAKLQAGLEGLFGLAQTPQVWRKLDEWIRRRPRASSSSGTGGDPRPSTGSSKPWVRAVVSAVAQGDGVHQFGAAHESGSSMIKSASIATSVLRALSSMRAVKPGNAATCARDARSHTVVPVSAATNRRAPSLNKSNTRFAWISMGQRPVDACLRWVTSKIRTPGPCPISANSSSSQSANPHKARCCSLIQQAGVVQSSRIVRSTIEGPSSLSHGLPPNQWVTDHTRGIETGCQTHPSSNRRLPSGLGRSCP